ncbi:hypothetical protein J23TS9_37970 [Paenibacillus sp. J23TS9]|nr:hypothetical protein J23TS9_37970 [Paenibacillus sp. J23TS9]
MSGDELRIHGLAHELTHHFIRKKHTHADFAGISRKTTLHIERWFLRIL